MGTCSSVQMLNEYMVRKRLGTPGLDLQTEPQKLICVAVQSQVRVLSVANSLKSCKVPCLGRMWFWFAVVSAILGISCLSLFEITFSP